MTHTSTEQPEALALQLAQFFKSMKKSSHRWWCGTPVHIKAAEEFERLHARVQELEITVETGKRLLREEMARANRYAEASQAQRAPLTYEQIENLQEKHVGGPCPSYPLDASDWINFARAIERAHGITQEKQG